MNTDDARHALRLPEGRLYVGVEADAPLKGYLSVRVHRLLLQTMLDLTRELPDLVTIIKPHPAHHIAMVDDIRDQFRALPNACWMDREALIEPALWASDVWIARYSTTLLEAALLSAVAISCLFDQEQRWKQVYGPLPLYVDTPDALRRLITLLVLQPTADTADWLDAELTRQRMELPMQYIGGARSAIRNAIARNR